MKSRNRLHSFARQGRRKLLQVYASVVAQAKTQLLWADRTNGKQAHRLPAKLIVSITSHAKRFDTLALTLKCLLSQSLRADETILWVGETDFRLLPRNVRLLEQCGLLIRTTRDLGPFTKLIPSLRAYPGSFVATADDDVYYDHTWLERLVGGYDAAHPSIVCHRAHRLRLDEAGKPLPYLHWEWEVSDPETSPYLLATGVGGTLYFPYALPDEATDENAFRSVAPHADDLWFYWMERRAGLNVTTLGHRRPLVTWLLSQRHGLNRFNVGGDTMNDTTIRLLTAAYGLPGPAPGMSKLA